jgi:tRNA threonylcarbamoyladenosine biosynthesis protein TsaB
MIILIIRTDKPEAEIGLYRDTEQLTYIIWQAHRALAETLHIKIRDMLTGHNLNMGDIQGVVCFRGPGSFTGLRIGLTVGNALAYGLDMPVVSETGDAWREQGITRLMSGEREEIAMPEYGADVHITLPKR